MEQSSVGLTLNSTVAYNMRYIGIESIFAIDKDIEYGPSIADCQYYFDNGNSEELLDVLNQFSRKNSGVTLDLNVHHQGNECNAIENICMLLNN